MKRFTNQSLKTYNTFGIDAVAGDLLEVERADELFELYQEGFFQNEYVLIGGGSDILFTNEVIPSVLTLRTGTIAITEDMSDYVIVTADGGVEWETFVQFCVDHNLGGVENLSLIPGSVGASVVQNIGAYGVEVKDVTVSVEYFDIIEGTFNTLTNEACCFAYRTSVFKKDLHGRAIVTRVSYKLMKQHSLNLEYADVLNYIEVKGMARELLTIGDIREMICEIRRSKLPHPQEIGNAGSFFKNPIITLEQFEILAKDYPALKPNPVDDHHVKVSAAFLIDSCGWKGWTAENGRYGVSEKHALVLVNYGGATGKEIAGLAENIQASVKEKFGIEMQPEVVYV
ncbi:MAG: UDP-N-acetylmuramate dehydrogenase [Candidatus Dojkabacteria bacterium]